MGGDLAGLPPIPGAELVRGREVGGALGFGLLAAHPYAGDGFPAVITVEGIAGFDPRVPVLGADGTELAENDDAGGLDARVEVVVAAGEQVTVEVSTFGDAAGADLVRVE